VLPKKYRLPKEKFQYIYKKGVKLRGRYGMLVSLKGSQLENPKLGIVVNKKIGNAVARHKMTRLIRNIFTETVKEEALEKSPALLQYIAFEFCDEYSFLKKEIREQIKKALS
jgi:ribonuclease P protein component